MLEKYKLEFFNMVKVDYVERLLRIVKFIGAIMFGGITRGIGYHMSTKDENGFNFVALLGTVIILGSVFLAIIAVLWWIIKNTYRIFKQGFWRINPFRLANELAIIGLPLYLLGPIFFTVTSRTIVVSDRMDPITYLGGNLLFTSLMLYGLVFCLWIYKKAVLVYNNRSN